MDDPEELEEEIAKLSVPTFSSVLEDAVEVPDTQPDSGEESDISEEEVEVEAAEEV